MIKVPQIYNIGLEPPSFFDTTNIGLNNTDLLGALFIAPLFRSSKTWVSKSGLSGWFQMWGRESGGGSKNSNLWPFFVWRTQWLVVICFHTEVKYWRWPPIWLAENSKDSLTPAAEIVVGFCSFASGWGYTVGKLPFGCCMASLEDSRTCCTWIPSLSPENDSLMSRRNLCLVNQDCAETH